MKISSATANAAWSSKAPADIAYASIGFRYQNSTVPHLAQNPRCAHSDESNRVRCSVPVNVTRFVRTEKNGEPPDHFRHMPQWHAVWSVSTPSAVNVTAPHKHRPVMPTSYGNPRRVAAVPRPMRLIAACLLLAACSSERPPPSDKDVTVEVVPPAAAKVGIAGTAQVTIRPGAGYHINTDYPWKLALARTPGLEASKGDIRARETELAVPITVTPTSAGDHELRGTVTLGMCKHDECLQREVPIVVAIAAR